MVLEYMFIVDFENKYLLEHMREEKRDIKKLGK